MYAIHKLRNDQAIDFAAEELKKYLRMMMLDCDDIRIDVMPDAKDGFRLGLFEDFGLDTSEVNDTMFDDVLHIETDENGGIIAGSNSRSVLFSVYRYLYENGCRWLYPGVDGEYIPLQDIQPVSYHYKPSKPIRGFCNEGAETQQCMLETIDFCAKLCMNVYMIEFDNPYIYYERYYGHGYNENRPPEPISFEQIMQWKRQCESEISRRGLMFHDMGHGWTADPFGFDSREGWTISAQQIPEESRQHLAEIDGKREFFHGIPINTNLCMSNPETRKIMVDGVVKYAKSHSNVDVLHVWLADDGRNHCECPECSKMRPSDYYMMIMNELDEALTAEGLDTRIDFCAYQDTLWAPEQITIKNPKRFILNYGLITRSYCESAGEDTPEVPMLPFVRNGWTAPRSIADNMNFVRDWQRTWKGISFLYEYHFWTRIYYDPANMAIARRIYEDVQSLDFMGIDGYVEDGSQRGFFPNAFAFYTYAMSLYDTSLSFESIRDDYFLHAYGEKGADVADYLQKLSDAFDFRYMCNEHKIVDMSKGKRYSPENAEKLATIPEIVKTMPVRPDKRLCRVHSVSYRLLDLHREYCEGIARIMRERALGNHDDAPAMQMEFAKQFGRHEPEIERYFDHYMCMYTYGRIHGVPDAKPVVPGA